MAGSTTTRRSSGWNRYYWHCVIPAWCDYTGYDKREMHEVLADHLLPVVDNDGRMTRESTAQLSPERFAHYVDDCRRLLAERADIYIPDPNEDVSHD